MRVLFIKFSGLTLLALLAASCSIQQRTVLPGFHIERMHKVSAKAELRQSRSAMVKEMPPLHVERLASEFTRPVLTVEQHLNTPPFAQVTTLHAIQPRVPDVDLVEPELLEPQPWDEAYRQQKFFGKLALGLLCLALGLLAAGAGHPLQLRGLFRGAIRQPSESQKSPRHQRGARRRCRAGTETVETVQHCLGGAAFASVAVAVAVAVMTILLFLLILGAIIGFFTSL